MDSILGTLKAQHVPVNNFSAPWWGSLAGHLPAGQRATGITGQ